MCVCVCLWYERARQNNRHAAFSSYIKCSTCYTVYPVLHKHTHTKILSEYVRIIQAVKISRANKTQNVMRSNRHIQQIFKSIRFSDAQHNAILMPSKSWAEAKLAVYISRLSFACHLWFIHCGSLVWPIRTICIWMLRNCLPFFLFSFYFFFWLTHLSMREPIRFKWMVWQPVVVPIPYLHTI